MFRLAILFGVLQVWPWLPMPQPFGDEPPLWKTVVAVPCRSGYVVGMASEIQFEVVMGTDSAGKTIPVERRRPLYRVRLCDADTEPEWYSVNEAEFKRLKRGQWFDSRDREKRR